MPTNDNPVIQPVGSLADLKRLIRAKTNQYDAAQQGIPTPRQEALQSDLSVPTLVNLAMAGAGMATGATEGLGGIELLRKILGREGVAGIKAAGKDLATQPQTYRLGYSMISRHAAGGETSVLDLPPEKESYFRSLMKVNGHAKEDIDAFINGIKDAIKDYGK